MLSMAAIVIALLGAILWVMWERIDSRREVDHQQTERIAAIEGSLHAILESIQHEPDE